MNFDQLMYLCDIKKTGSINATAEKFFISHQGVSKAIKNLENFFGKSLIIRSSKGCTLTEDGLFIAEKADQILEIYKQILENYPIEKAEKSLSGELSIISIPRIIDDYLENAIFKFAQKHQNVNLNLKSASPKEIIDLMATSTFDIGFCGIYEMDLHEGIFQAKLNNNALNFNTLFREEIFACLSKKKLSEINIECFEPQKNLDTIISYKYDFPYSSHRTCNLTFEVNSIQAQQRLINNELGVGMVTKREFEQFYAKKKKFILIPISPPVYFHFGYIVSNKQPLSILQEEFLKYI